MMNWKERSIKMEMESFMADAANRISENRKRYGALRSFYKRAAIQASQKLGMEISEYHIVMVQIALAESKIALRRVDDDTYAELSALFALAGDFSHLKAENFRETMMTDVEEEIKDIARRLAPDDPQ